MPRTNARTLYVWMDGYMHVCMYVCMYACMYDTIEHVFNTCSIWKGLLRQVCLLLSRVSLNPPTALHPLELMNETGNLRTFFVILMTTYWTKRKTLPPVGIMNSFKWHLRRHIRTVCARKSDISFWKPLGPFVNLALVQRI